ncbi:hypothetical protein MNBD_ALPHA09-1940 [hydrothermal vent metagenome]|uniref:Isoprenylcysteine carboxylmethyltransferase family protein n=1 Tax=hydrothermal vent metagenome TaxID=652676 RepID=A0A3B0TUA7_9ZZZZ
MADAKPDKPGVIAPPPLIFLAGILIGVAVDQFWSGSFWPGPMRHLIAVPLILGGLVAAFMVLLRFREAGTNIEPYKPTTAIVTDGLFSWSRNPVYLAMVAVTIGVGLALDNFWVLAMLILVLPVMHHGVIIREERYLTDKFGGDYTRYKNTVRRWL